MSIIDNPTDGLVVPSYSVYRYTDCIYKVVHFKREKRPVRLTERKENHQSYDIKLEASLSRARSVVLQLALCNEWKWFASFTISKDKFNREDLTAWDKFLKQWLRDRRKSYGVNFKYLLVPEQHKNGAWHMHGLFSDEITPFLLSFRLIHDRPIPKKLIDGDFYDWPDYFFRFGFCSFGVIRDKRATAFYVSKYITKSMIATAMQPGLHLYTCSQGLQRRVKHGDVYGYHKALSDICTQHYEFCDTGFTGSDLDLDWSFALEYMDYDLISAEDLLGISTVEAEELDRRYEWIQTTIEELYND